MRSSIICENAYSRLSNIPVIPFGVSVNPIPTWWDNYAHRITACPSRFENLTALYTYVHINLAYRLIHIT